MRSKNKVALAVELSIQDFSRPMVDFVALNCGILIAKRLFNRKSM